MPSANKVVLLTQHPPLRSGCRAADHHVMSTEKTTIQFTPTMADIQAGSRLRMEKNPKIVRLILVPCGLFLLLAGFGCYVDGMWEYKILVPLAVVALLLVDVIVPGLNYCRVAILVNRNRELYLRSITLELHADSFSVTTEDGSTSETPWSALVGYRLGPKNLLLYMSRDLALNIPLKAFSASDIPETDLIALLQKKGLRKR